MCCKQVFDLNGHPSNAIETKHDDKNVTTDVPSQNYHGLGLFYAMIDTTTNSVNISLWNVDIRKAR